MTVIYERTDSVPVLGSQSDVCVQESYEFFDNEPPSKTVSRDIYNGYG